MFKLSARALSATLLSAAAIGGTLTFAGSAPSTAAAAHTPASIPAPPGYQKVYDDLTMLAVSIPNDWIVSDSTPQEIDGVLYPSLRASESAPGTGSELWYLGAPREEPLLPFEPECTPEQEAVADCEPFYGVEPYDDGWYAGYHARMGVGTTGQTRQVVKVNPEGSPYTVYLEFRESASDPAVFDTMLATFELTQLAYEPLTVVAPSPTTAPTAPTVAPAPAPTVAPAPAPTTAAPTPGPSTGTTPGMVPVDGFAVDQFWGQFRAVPQLGSEPVRGSGCGGNGEIGDVIPDGTWAAFVSWNYEVDYDAYDVDLLCVFTPEAAPGIVAAGTATIINDDPNYLVVNNNTRTRGVPTTMFVAQFQYVDDGNGNCVIDPVAAGPGDPSRQAWIQIENGIATAVGWDCHPLGAVATTPG